MTAPPNLQYRIVVLVQVVRALNAVLPNGWRAEMSTVRSIAYRLAREGRVNILQRGAVVNTKDFPARGPIRIGHAGVERSGQ